MIAIIGGEIDKLEELDGEVRVGGRAGLQRALREVGCTPRRVRTKVRRVDKLARGVLVRTEHFQVGSYSTTIRTSAMARAREDRRPVVHVTRIKRA